MKGAFFPLPSRCEITHSWTTTIQGVTRHKQARASFNNTECLVWQFNYIAFYRECLIIQALPANLLQFILAVRIKYQWSTRGEPPPPPPSPPLFSPFTWRSPTNSVHPLILITAFAWGLKQRMRRRLRQKIQDSETCCIQLGVVSFQPDMG